MTGRGPGPGLLPAGLVLAGAVSVQSGAGFADRLFGQLPPASVTTLRLWSAALILLLMAGRSAARAVAGLAAGRAWTDGAITLAYGIALGFMNFAIYQAFARIPLGIAVTIEFLGPLAVTVTGTLRGPAVGTPHGRRHRRAAGLGYAALAAAGVVLLAGTVGGARLNWAGVAWAAAAGTAWAAYILGSKAAGQRLPGASGLVIAMCVAAIAVTAPGVIAGTPKMFRLSFLAAGAGIGLLSSVIPYWLELEALRRIPTSLFGVWMSVQPAVAALIGLAALGQRLSAAEWTGVCCVVAASAGAATVAPAPDGLSAPGKPEPAVAAAVPPASTDTAPGETLRVGTGQQAHGPSWTGDLQFASPVTARTDQARAVEDSVRSAARPCPAPRRPQSPSATARRTSPRCARREPVP